MKTILNVFQKRWHTLLLLIPSAVIAYALSVWLGFLVSIDYGDFVAISAMKIIFAVLAPLPTLLYWKEIIVTAHNRLQAVLFCVLLQAVLIGLFWWFING